MKESAAHPNSITHPALLGLPRAFEREAHAIARHAADAELFDLPLEGQGLEGLTQPEAQVVRAFDAVAQAFGINGEALAEWHRLLAFDASPGSNSVLVRDHGSVLRDVLLRVRTLAYFHDAEGRGPLWIRYWRRTRILLLYVEAFEFAPTLGKAINLLYEELPGCVRGLRNLKQFLHAHGLTASGWRWLASYEGPPWEHDGIARSRAHYVVDIANAMATLPPEAHEDEVFGLHAALMALYAAILNAGLGPRPWLLAAAWRQFSELEDASERELFVLGEFMEVGQWAVDSPWIPDANQRRAGWRAIVRAYQGASAVDLPFVSWAVPFECVEANGYLAVPIANTQQLKAEGDAMGHCIADYAGNCANGELIVFSARGWGGQRVATFSLKWSPGRGRWVRHACKGRFNAAVTDERALALVDACADTANCAIKG